MVVKLSLKTEYACRVLAQLARRYDGSQLTHIEELASAEAVPANYLVQILNELRNSGLIVSRRGKLGGYALVRPAKEISLYDIVRAVDSELLETTVSQHGQSGPRVAEIWKEIGDTLEATICKYTLDSFLPKSGDAMYYI